MRGLHEARRRAYLECDVVVSDADLQLLFADDVFLWPVRVVFPIERVSGRCPWSLVYAQVCTHLMISLCPTMRFNSFTTRGPTHTDGWMGGWMNGA
jgi:hypothetical protein